MKIERQVVVSKQSLSDGVLDRSESRWLPLPLNRVYLVFLLLCQSGKGKLHRLYSIFTDKKSQTIVPTLPFDMIAIRVMEQEVKRRETIKRLIEEYISDYPELRALVWQEYQRNSQFITNVAEHSSLMGGSNDLKGHKEELGRKLDFLRHLFNKLHYFVNSTPNLRECFLKYKIDASQEQQAAIIALLQGKL